VFAAKIMWPYMAGLVDGLSTIPRHRGLETPHELLADAFPGLRHVWLRRLDKVRQAVSLWRAVQTWSWRQDSTRGCEQAGTAGLRYSFDAIDHLRRRLIASDRAWEIYFDGTQLAPLTLTYEDFVERMHETVERLLDHVGVTSRPGDGYCVPRTARQSDEVTEQWVAEFRAEFDGRVPAVG
jgi:LPS sulfotransferase NodH